jgi:hypothetical protein
LLSYTFMLETKESQIYVGHKRCWWLDGEVPEREGGTNGTTVKLTTRIYLMILFFLSTSQDLHTAMSLRAFAR